MPTNNNRTVSTRGLRRFVARYGLSIDLVGLFLSFVVVHMLYVVFIGPAADQAIALAESTGTVPDRTLAVVFKDLEQEMCLILTLWCIWLWFFRYRLFQSESYLLELDILRLDRLDAEADHEDTPLLDFVDTRVQQLRASMQGSQLIEALDLAVQRIRLNQNFHEANDVAVEACDLHLELLNSRLSISKYILWAIPSIGFLGTVRGISEALSKAHEAMAGDISGIGASLGVAFNSTYVALFLSLLLMLISNALQGREERLVARFKHFVSSTFIPVLSTRLTEGSITRDPSAPTSIEQ